MRAVLLQIFAVTVGFRLVAGDMSDGENRYAADFKKSGTAYEMNKGDFRWEASLLRNLKEKGKVVHFVRTDLSLFRDEEKVRGMIYRCVEKPDFYYIAEGNVMLNFGRRKIYSPGVGGFSMHAPLSRDFFVCLNFQSGGIPFARHAPIAKARIWWFASKANVGFEDRD